jgi:integrase
MRFDGFFAHLEGAHLLLARLLYGTGMRITEALRLRVKDIEFDRLTIIVREGKGGKDRAVMLPQALVAGLKQQLVYSNALWTLDRNQQRNGVEIPFALEKNIRAPALHGPGIGRFAGSLVD